MLIHRKKLSGLRPILPLPARIVQSGHPHLEECRRFAELVFPLLPPRTTTGNSIKAAGSLGPFGEIIANVAAPQSRVAAG